MGDNQSTISWTVYIQWVTHNKYHMVSVVLLAIRSGLDQALVLQVWGRELCEQVLLVHSDPMVQDLLRDPHTGQLRFKPPNGWNSQSSPPLHLLSYFASIWSSLPSPLNYTPSTNYASHKDTNKIYSSTMLNEPNRGRKYQLFLTTTSNPTPPLQQQSPTKPHATTTTTTYKSTLPTARPAPLC